MRVFREDGRHAGCCLEDGSNDELGLVVGRAGDEGELGLDEVNTSSHSSSSSSGESSSSGGYDQPPCHRARIKGGGGSSRHHAPVKQEESLD